MSHLRKLLWAARLRNGTAQENLEAAGTLLWFSTVMVALAAALVIGKAILG